MTRPPTAAPLIMTFVPVRLAIAFIAAALGACAPRTVPPLAPLPSVEGCIDALTQRGALFDRAPERAAANRCALAGGVELRQSSLTFEPGATMACPLALSLMDFETHVLQPAADRYFGQPVHAVRQIGAYSCRMRAGTRRLSEHGHGRAIDIAAFQLADGTRIIVKDHWRERGPRGAFLREIARSACVSFSVVLTPNSDADHADHIHLDIGPQRHCGA